MNKRILALVLALALCMTCTAAFAANSKTTRDIVTVVADTTVNTVTVTAPTAESKAVLEAITALVNEGKPVTEFFDADTQAKIAEAMPDVQAANLKMDELIPVSGKAVRGSKLTLSTAANYTGKRVLPMAGIVRNGVTVWVVLPYQIVGGKIVVDLTDEVIAGLEDGSVMIAVMSVDA